MDFRPTEKNIQASDFDVATLQPMRFDVAADAFWRCNVTADAFWQAIGRSVSLNWLKNALFLSLIGQDPELKIIFLIDSTSFATLGSV